MILAAQGSWLLSSNQLKFVNRQLHHKTAGLELEHNKKSFIGHRDIPAIATVANKMACRLYLSLILSLTLNRTAVEQDVNSYASSTTWLLRS
jgi:hypothetical protein